MIAINAKFRDNSKLVLSQMTGNVEAALEAMGTKAVGMIVSQMQGGYGKPIRQTGNLMRDVQHETVDSEKIVRVGNTLNYAPHVHEGTYKMKGRPYINDALLSRTDVLEQTASDALKKGF